jgi:PAS domain S-box-containing protein
MSDTNKSVPNGSAPLRSGHTPSQEDEPVLAERIHEVVIQAQVRQPRAQEWFDVATDGYLLTDLQGVVHEANHSALTLLGVRSEFLLGKPLGLFIAEDNHKTFYERLARLARFSDVELWETRLARPQGRPRQVMLLASAQTGEKGTQLRWVIRDITDLREAQRQTLQAERLAAIGQMAAGMAHEGRNALQRTQAALSLLTLRLKDQPECLDLLGRMQKAQDDLQRLFEDVRNYAIAPRLQRRWHDLQQIWREAWEELAGLPEWQSAALREDIDNVDPICQVDCFYLKHVFRNLLENALSCGAKPVRVVIRCQPAVLGTGEAVRLCLRDNGPGIPAEARARLFEPFCTTKARGTGLGLAICKRIIEAHGGRIEASACPPVRQGNGSTGAEMVITLPRRGA